jgi:riboflavin synthase
MFTGIVSHIGKVKDISHPNDWELSISVQKLSQSEPSFDFDKLITGASIACSGICLTLKKKSDNMLFFDVSDETASKTNFLNWKIGTIVNLEKSLKVGDELGGHFVYGHVDTTSKISSIEKINGSFKILFYVQDQFMKYFSPKGSVSIDGVSLTVNEVFSDTFSVNIISHTWAYTSFLNFKIGTVVNIEIDILARYLERLNAKK